MRYGKMIKVLSVVAVLATAVVAQAVPIQGTIKFDGSGDINTTSLLSATAFNSFHNVYARVGAETGDYAGLGGVFFWMNGFTFAPPPGSAPVDPWWYKTVSGTLYSFVISTIDIDFQSASILKLSGEGVAKITGFTDTAGFWSLTVTDKYPTAKRPYTLNLKFSSDVLVPDGGITVALLGFALVGMEGLRRKMRK